LHLDESASNNFIDRDWVSIIQFVLAKQRLYDNFHLVITRLKQKIHDLEFVVTRPNKVRQYACHDKIKQVSVILLVVQDQKQKSICSTVPFF
jgi:hypothetical protein